MGYEEVKEAQNHRQNLVEEEKEEKKAELIVSPESFNPSQPAMQPLAAVDNNRYQDNDAELDQDGQDQEESDGSHNNSLNDFEIDQLMAEAHDDNHDEINNER